MQLVELRNPGWPYKGGSSAWWFLLAGRPAGLAGPSSVAIVLCGSSQQPARRNVAWTVSQGM